MARQLARIARGESAASAYDNDPTRTIRRRRSCSARWAGCTACCPSRPEPDAHQPDAGTARRAAHPRTGRGQPPADAVRKLAAIGQLAAAVAHEINTRSASAIPTWATLSRYFGDLKAVIDAYRSGDAGRIAAAVEAADLEFLLDDVARPARRFARRPRRVRRSSRICATFRASTAEAATDRPQCGAGRDPARRRRAVRAGVEVVSEFGELPPVVCDAARSTRCS
jgi:signal transduction histidine kinase